ncbi:MAG: hypothetical protein IJA01_06560 [Firmicutes bacterium]|nr:hypothetical protein [Bacillota bacterium]
MDIRWEDDFKIEVEIVDDEVIIAANKDGLKSLANICNDLADAVEGNHIHLDEHNSLEENSTSMILCLIK